MNGLSAGTGSSRACSPRAIAHTLISGTRIPGDEQRRIWPSGGCTRTGVISRHAWHNDGAEGESRATAGLPYKRDG